jgi:type II secretory pathway component PulF
MNHLTSRISAEDLGTGLRILADLLEAGLPMTRTLALFGELAPGSWRPALGPMQASLRDGKSFASALAEAPIAIPELVIGLARAGEAGQGIAGAVRRAAGHAEAVAARRAAFRAALAYPTVVAVAGAATLAVMIGLVLPRFAQILADLGQQLPPVTRAVLATATTVRAALPAALVIGLVASLAAFDRLRTPRGRAAFHEFLLGLPMIGPLRSSLASSRLLASLAPLLASGVPVQRGMAFAARSSGDLAIVARVDAAREMIAGGRSLASSLLDAGAVTSAAAKLIRAGEESGRLVPMLEHASAMEGARVERVIHLVVRSLEPLLIVLFAGLVGIVAIALLQAVYAVRPM